MVGSVHYRYPAYGDQESDGETMPGIEPEKNGMEQLLESVQGSFRSFLNSAVGVDMGKLMLPDVYGETKPATAEKHVDWSGVVCDEHGDDTGMRVQVWNGDGSVAETTMCSDIAMVLHDLSAKHEAEGSDVTSSDIGNALRQYFSENLRSQQTETSVLDYYTKLAEVVNRQMTATDLCKLYATLNRMRDIDFVIPPENFSGSASDFIRHELTRNLDDLHSPSLIMDAEQWRALLLANSPHRVLGTKILAELDNSIYKDLLGAHPDLIELPMSERGKDLFRVKVKRYYPEITEEQLQYLVDLFFVDYLKETEQ